MERSTQTDISFWDTVSEKSGICLPQGLRMILTALCYDHSCALSSFSDKTCTEHFNKIETFMRCKMHHLVDPFEKKLYFGIFQHKPELFELLEGQKVLLTKIGNYFWRQEQTRDPTSVFIETGARSTVNKSMSALADKTMLAVLSHLDVPDLLEARAVCRRWRHLALRPELWDRVNIFPFDWATQKLALRLVPCLPILAIREGTPAGMLEAATTTCCAIKSLFLEVKPDTAAVGLELLKNQVVLGRIYELKLFFCSGFENGKEAHDFLKVIQNSGLRELTITFRNYSSPQMAYDNLRPTVEGAVSKLRVLAWSKT